MGVSTVSPPKTILVGKEEYPRHDIRGNDIFPSPYKDASSRKLTHEDTSVANGGGVSFRARLAEIRHRLARKYTVMNKNAKALILRTKVYISLSVSGEDWIWCSVRHHFTDR